MSDTDPAPTFTVGEMRRWLDARNVSDDTPIFIEYDDPAEIRPTQLASRGLTLEESTVGGFILTVWS